MKVVPRPVGLLGAPVADRHLDARFAEVVAAFKCGHGELNVVGAARIGVRDAPDVVGGDVEDGCGDEAFVVESANAVGGAAADEAWLSKLAASLPAQGATSTGDDASVKTSKSSKSSATAGGSSLVKASVKKKKPSKAETKNDDPTSFFESLMKK